MMNLDPAAVGLPASVKLNPDAEMVTRLANGLTRTGGYCPCRLNRTPETLCPCQEFRLQAADPAFHGLCHCKLYLKE